MSTQPDDKIILNVGGTKYGTFRTTITKYPKTLLGEMFLKNMIQPTNGNEYFIDRDGPSFRYILQYYRNNGKINWPNSNQLVSTEDLMDELNYFQIPIPTQNHDSSSERTERTRTSTKPMRPTPSTASLPNFINAFDKVMEGMTSNRGTQTSHPFSFSGSSSMWYEAPETSASSTVAVEIRFGNGYIVIEPKNYTYEELFRPFENNGLDLIRKNGSVIKNNLTFTEKVLPLLHETNLFQGEAILNRTARHLL
ncbi:BTB/POZ protein [Glomus cerebriforme]|uniref:BTB/POZ protein n=1 Tax=Glomus cerebriforme TaxID=658196 RepID=A0A397SJ15_9GLOM|nr:BTB/POZ protein [Glomus cerebriforme]